MMRFALAVLLALICGSAQAQILTYKHFPRTLADAPTANFELHLGTYGMVDTGFPPLDKRGFVKLRNDTGLRCHIAFDFLVGNYSGVLASTITVDDGSKWNAIEGPAKLAGYMTAEFWGITFRDVPAGPHSIYVTIGGVPGTFYNQYAMLQCYEETLGVEQ